MKRPKLYYEDCGLGRGLKSFYVTDKNAFEKTQKLYPGVIKYTDVIEDDGKYILRARTYGSELSSVEYYYSYLMAMRAFFEFTEEAENQYRYTLEKHREQVERERAEKEKRAKRLEELRLEEELKDKERNERAQAAVFNMLYCDCPIIAAFVKKAECKGCRYYSYTLHACGK